MPFFSFYKTKKEQTFFQALPNPTRFDQCSELKEIGALVERLRKKTTDLVKDWTSKGAASVGYSKHTVVADLLNKLDADIVDFNNALVPVIHTDEAQLQNMLALVAKLNATVIEVSTNNDKNAILKTDRNIYKKVASQGTDVGPTGLTATIATAVSATFGVGVIACLAALGASYGIKKYTGLDNLDPESYIIVTALVKELSEVEKNIQYKLRMSAPVVAAAAFSAAPRA